MSSVCHPDPAFAGDGSRYNYYFRTGFLVTLGMTGSILLVILNVVKDLDVFGTRFRALLGMTEIFLCVILSETKDLEHMEQTHSVYIATNQRNTVLYTGITRDIYRRMSEHKEKKVKGFTSKYNVDKLIYHEEFQSPMEAIAAEKRIKGWTRAKKIALIESTNPEWKDLIELERDSSLHSE